MRIWVIMTNVGHMASHVSKCLQMENCINKRCVSRRREKQKRKGEGKRKGRERKEIEEKKRKREGEERERERGRKGNRRVLS